MTSAQPWVRATLYLFTHTHRHFHIMYGFDGMKAVHLRQKQIKMIHFVRYFIHIMICYILRYYTSVTVRFFFLRSFIHPFRHGLSLFSFSSWASFSLPFFRCCCCCCKSPQIYLYKKSAHTCDAIAMHCVCVCVLRHAGVPVRSCSVTHILGHTQT